MRKARGRSVERLLYYEQGHEPTRVSQGFFVRKQDACTPRKIACGPNHAGYEAVSPLLLSDDPSALESSTCGQHERIHETRLSWGSPLRSASSKP